MTLNMNRPRQNENTHGSPELGLFGYFFSSDEPAPAPDAPAQGEPLLNDYELDTTHQFFDKFQNDQYADETKLFDSFGAFQDPIPNLHSVGSTLGQPHIHGNERNHALGFSHFDHDLNLRFDQANLSSPHAEHFSPQTSLPFQPGTFAPYDARRPGHSRHHSDAFGTHNAFDPPPNTTQRSDFSRQSAPALGHGSLVFGGDPSFSSLLPTTNQQRTLPVGEKEAVTAKSIAPALGFGSDQGFRKQNYIPPKHTQDELKSAEQTVADNMTIFEAHKQDSTDNTAASSPVMTKSKRRLSEDVADSSKPTASARKIGESNENHVSVGDKRQRKVKIEGSEDNDSEVAIAGKSRVTKKGKPGAKARTMSEGASGHGARRKSQAAEKASRQNLTEEEKKLNHIRSEQKRRNQIKDGFADLTALMPEGTPAGTSKCAILSQAVDWLSGLIEGNKKLRAQLKELGG